MGPVFLCRHRFGSPKLPAGHDPAALPLRLRDSRLITALAGYELGGADSKGRTLARRLTRFGGREVPRPPKNRRSAHVRVCELNRASLLNSPW